MRGRILLLNMRIPINYLSQLDAYEPPSVDLMTRTGSTAKSAQTTPLNPSEANAVPQMISSARGANDDGVMVQAMFKANDNRSVLRQCLIYEVQNAARAQGALGIGHTDDGGGTGLLSHLIAKKNGEMDVLIVVHPQKQDFC